MLLPHLTCSFLQASGCWEFTPSLPALGDMELGAGGWDYEEGRVLEGGRKQGKRSFCPSHMPFPGPLQMLDTQDLEVCPNAHTPPSWKLLRFQGFFGGGA